MAGPRGLQARLALAPVTQSILGDVFGFVTEAVIGKAGEKFFPPPGPIDPGPRTPEPVPVATGDPFGDAVSVDPVSMTDRLGIVGGFPSAGPCFPGFTQDPITGECRFDIDPGPGQGLPGGNGAAGGGLSRPRATSRTVLECPRFADGKKGILWMNALTGDVVCLPRATNGRGFGLIRKNTPRAKPFISAADKKLLTKITSVQKKAKSFATSAGFICRDKPGQPAPAKKKK